MSRQEKPTIGQLEAMASHVVYEIDMFRRGFARWRTLHEDDPDWNPALENALLHFRVLREFFLDPPKKADDVAASDYSEDWDPLLPRILEDTKEEIDKRLAHLTLQRLIRPGPWKRGEMEAAMESLITSFKKSLVGREATWFFRLGVKSSAKIIVGDVCGSTESTTKGS